MVEQTIARHDHIFSLRPNRLGGCYNTQHTNAELPMQSFVDPDPFQELTFPTVIAAKQALADYLGRPLAKLTSEQMADIDAICADTLNKQAVMSQIRDYFKPLPGRPHVE